MPARRIFVFDAYGTLFDVHSAASREREAVGAGWERLSDLWRTKQRTSPARTALRALWR